MHQSKLYYLYDEQTQQWGNTPLSADSILAMKNLSAETYISSYDRTQFLQIKDLQESRIQPTTTERSPLQTDENTPTKRAIRVACCIYIATNIMGVFVGLGIVVSSMFRHPKPALGASIGAFFGIFATYILLRIILGKTPQRN